MSTPPERRTQPDPVAPASVTDVTDVSVGLDAVPGPTGLRCRVALTKGWGEAAEPLCPAGKLPRPFYLAAEGVLKAATAEEAGGALFDWAFPPGGGARRALLGEFADTLARGGLLRLWLCAEPRFASLVEYRLVERYGLASWEGLWVREWAGPGGRPPGVTGPFLALNPRAHVVRRAPGSVPARRLAVPGKLNVLIITSDPAPGGDAQPIGYMRGLLLRVYRPFFWHPRIGWVYVLRNPAPAKVARVVGRYRPHIVVYIGHGYASGNDAGLVLAADDGSSRTEHLSGVGPDGESPLARVLAGKWEAPGRSAAAGDGKGLPPADRPRLFIAVACKAAAASPSLLQCGVPAVLAMRREIPDSAGTEAMVGRWVDGLTDQSASIEEAISGIRRFLNENEGQAEFGHQGLHFSVPVLHLAADGSPK